MLLLETEERRCVLAAIAVASQAEGCCERAARISGVDGGALVEWHSYWLEGPF